MDKKIEKAIFYLSKNFRKKTNLYELAKSVGMSPFHFHRKFVAENGITPQAYLENIRMQHAKHIIEALPHYSITDVAFDSGYSSPGIFSRAFKKYYGIAPSKYQPESKQVSEELVKEQNSDIQYLTKKIISVQKVRFINEELNIAYQQLKSKAGSSKTIYGFFLDAPFHVPLKNCRYLMGTIASNEEMQISNFIFPAGYYTSLFVKGGFHHLKEKLIVLNEYIQQKGFVLDSIIGYEKIQVVRDNHPFDYNTATREIFMKIKRI